MSMRQRPQLERLEAREVPAISTPWVDFQGYNGDLMDRLIKQVLPHTKSGLQFFANLSGWLYGSLEGSGGSNIVHSRNDADGYLADLWADCSERDEIMRMAAARLGVMARPVGLAGVPVQSNHVI